MKKQFVETLQEGDRVNDYFLATRRDLRTQQNGSMFLGMVFKDRTGEIGGILWNNAPSVARLFKIGDVVNVMGVVSSYQDRLQIRVDQVLPLRQEEFTVDDLVLTPSDLPEVEEKLRTILGTVQDPYLAKLVQAFLNDENFMGRMRIASAGRKWHHAYPGGLLRHCYEVARIVETSCEIFPEANRDLLLAAVLLHDIGKLEEMSHGLLVDYTDAGRLLGHLAIGCDEVSRRIDTIEGFPETLRLQLLHCILSHHGELSNGSPVLPKTIEAVILCHSDNLDAQADAFARIADETRQRGEAWSEYIPLIDRQIWTKEEREL